MGPSTHGQQTRWFKHQQVGLEHGRPDPLAKPGNDIIVNAQLIQPLSACHTEGMRHLLDVDAALVQPCLNVLVLLLVADVLGWVICREEWDIVPAFGIGVWEDLALQGEAVDQQVSHGSLWTVEGVPAYYSMKKGRDYEHSCMNEAATSPEPTSMLNVGAQVLKLFRNY